MFISTKADFYLGLSFLIASSAFAGMIVTVLLARYGVIDLPPIP